MTDSLYDLVDAQRQLQLSMPSGDPMLLVEEGRTEFISWNVLALTDELHELLNEVGWKPWATSRHVNEDLAMKELIDAFHFFMNIMMAIAPSDRSLRDTVDAFIEGYHAKHEVNRKRQEDGYDGITGKCPACKRERASAQPVLLETQGDPISQQVCPCGYVWQDAVGGKLA